MIGWRFLLSKQWAGYLALAIVFAIVCCALGMWQLNRRAEAQAEIVRIEANYDSAPVAIDEALSSLDGFDAASKWKPVKVTGTYLVEEQVLVRNRPFGGRPGFEVLTPLQLDNGRVFIVNRGWVAPGSNSKPPLDLATPPPGEVTVVARLKASEPVLVGRSAPPGQIATIHLPDLAQRIGEPTFTGAYGLLVSESPAPQTSFYLAAKPERDEGPHLSYALQWFVFAIFGFVGLGYAARQEFRTLNSDDPAEQERERLRENKRLAKAKTDAQIEDELLDAR